jgi:hypothetical protein
MKNTMFLIYCLFLFIGCKDSFNNNNFTDCESILQREIRFNDEICKFISDFIRERNNADYIYEFYLDKKTSDEYFNQANFKQIEIETYAGNKICNTIYLSSRKKTLKNEKKII